METSAGNGTCVQLIYIHGFRGDHTTFQAFPTHLHETLLKKLPVGLNIESCLYPTYKSRRPISEATVKFLEWLSKRPMGPVVLLSHSMGGLLAAEAAISSSPQSKRVIGLVAFDVPFLGMHPHVIISGIASLFPTDAKSGQQSESELNNDSLVEIERSSTFSTTSSTFPEVPIPTVDTLPLHSPPPSGSRISEQWEAHKASFSSQTGDPSSSTSSRAQSPLPSSLSTFLSAHRSSSSLLSGIKSLPTSSIPFADKLEKAAELVSKQSNNPMILWLRKHSDDPLSAMTTWVVEHFEFGICMFDPNGLNERYRNLENWDGKWINYWTQTVPRDGEVERHSNEPEVADSLPANTADLPISGGHEYENTPYTSKLAELAGKEREKQEKAALKERKAAEKAMRKQRERERKREEPRPARHFIVLPHLSGTTSSSVHFGSREKWDEVTIAGVEDEVGAHCGLFIPSQNLDYAAFVERVADTVAGWCEHL